MANFAALNSSIFICSSCSVWDHTPPTDVFWQNHPPNLSLMHLTLSKILPGEKVKTSRLTVLGLISTSLVAPCRIDIELLCCCNLFSRKGCEFVVSARNPYRVVQKELLILLMIMFWRAWLGLLWTLPALAIYADTSWKLILPSPEARTLSSPPSLSWSVRILFSVLGEELISLSL